MMLYFLKLLVKMRMYVTAQSLIYLSGTVNKIAVPEDDVNVRQWTTYYCVRLQVCVEGGPGTT